MPLSYESQHWFPSHNKPSWSKASFFSIQLRWFTICCRVVLLRGRNSFASQQNSSRNRCERPTVKISMKHSHTQSDIVRIEVNCFSGTIFNITQTARGARALPSSNYICGACFSRPKQISSHWIRLGFLPVGVSIISVLIDFTCDTPPRELIRVQ